MFSSPSGAFIIIELIKGNLFYISVYFIFLSYSIKKICIMIQKFEPTLVGRSIQDIQISYK